MSNMERINSLEQKIMQLEADFKDYKKDTSNAINCLDDKYYALKTELENLKTELLVIKSTTTKNLTLTTKLVDKLIGSNIAQISWLQKLNWKQYLIIASFIIVIIKLFSGF